MKDLPAPKTRADVMAIPLPLAATAVLHFLLEHEPRVWERAEIAAALGAKPSTVEIELVRMQRRRPILLSRTGPDGKPIGGRHGFIPADSPLRKAWATTPIGATGFVVTKVPPGADLAGVPVEDAPPLTTPPVGRPFPIGEMLPASAPPIGRGTTDADVAPPDTHVDFAPIPASSVGVLDEPDDRPKPSRKKKDKE